MQISQVVPIFMLLTKNHKIRQFYHCETINRILFYEHNSLSKKILNNLAKTNKKVNLPIVSYFIYFILKVRKVIQNMKVLLEVAEFEEVCEQSKNNVSILQDENIESIFNNYKKVVLVIGFIAAFLHTFPNAFDHTISRISLTLLVMQYTFQYLIKIKLSKI